MFGDFDVTGVILMSFRVSLNICEFSSVVHMNKVSSTLPVPMVICGLPPRLVTSCDSDLLPYSGQFGRLAPSCSSVLNFCSLVPPHQAAFAREWAWSSIMVKLAMVVSTCSGVMSSCVLDSLNASVISHIASVCVMFPCVYSPMRLIQR